MCIRGALSCINYTQVMENQLRWYRVYTHVVTILESFAKKVMRKDIGNLEILNPMGWSCLSFFMERDVLLS